MTKAKQTIWKIRDKRTGLYLDKDRWHTWTEQGTPYRTFVGAKASAKKKAFATPWSRMHYLSHVVPEIEDVEFVEFVCKEKTTIQAKDVV